jgi:SAM-dependent methyltransferase
VKEAYKSLYRIPVLGFAARWLAGLARLPQRFESYDAQLAELHVRTSLFEAQGARLGELERQLAGMSASLSQMHDLAHRGAQAGQDALAQASQLRGAFDQHLPALLNLVSSTQSSLRLLRREQEEARAESSNAVADANRSIEELRMKMEEVAQAALAAESARQAAATMLASVASDIAPRIGRIEAVLPQQAAEAESRDAATRKGIDTLRQGLDGLAGDVGALRSTAGDAVNRLSGTSAAVQDLQSTAAFLLGRVEFVRRELLFELRYGVGAAGSAVESRSRVVNAKKVQESARKGLRLNVGCGHLPAEGYVNVDLRELPGVDVVAEATDLPFEAGKVEEIYSAHLLEHFPQEQLVRQVLPHWRRLLKNGGVLRSVVPDAEAMIAHYGQGAYPYEDLREVLYGSQDYEGDFHFNMFTPASLRELLEGAGFSQYEVVEAGRRNGRCYEFEAVARAAP